MDQIALTLTLLDGRFAVCRLDERSPVPEWAFGGEFYSITRTPDELSIICPADNAPLDALCEVGWRCFKVHGPFDFSLTGILHSLTAPLTEAGISVFAISTYDTDYLMVKAEDLAGTVDALAGAGHMIRIT